MRRAALLAALLLFLIAVLGWPLLGIPARYGWGPLLAGVAAAALTALAETRGRALLRGLAATFLVFGAAFPWIAVHGLEAYRFGPAAGDTVLGLPPLVPLGWLGFGLLSLALGDSLRWWAASGGRQWQGPWISGACLAGMEMLWDPVLLAEGVLVAPVAGPVAWPLGYAPAFAAFHFLVGTGFAELADRMARTGRCETSAWARGGSMVLGTALLYAACPPPRFLVTLATSSPLAAGLGEAAVALAGALALARLLRAGVRRAVPRLPARILLVTPTGPVAPDPGGEDPLDFYSSRFTRGQGPWRSEVELPYLGAHRIAANLSPSVAVLEYPTVADFEEELREVPYEIVGIGFTLVSRDVVHRMCRTVRRIRPEARIVLGGYGVVCLDSARPGDPGFEGLVDSVCRDEGAAFMRSLVGDEPGAPLVPNLPGQELFPLGIRLLPQRMQPVVAGFGCRKRCGFCATSAFFDGREVGTAGAAELADAIAAGLARDPGTIAFAIFEEDFLADRARAEELASRLSSMPGLDFGKVRLSAFATVASLLESTPEELARAGIAYLWIGVESKFSPLGKLDHARLGALLAALRDQGIAVTLSWVMGFDFQTPENLGEDLDWFAGLPMATAQVSLLGPVPGTALHRRMEKARRLLPTGWEHQHLYAESMVYAHFEPGRLAPWVERAYATLYRRQGPSVLRAAEAWLSGWIRHRRHSDPRLAARGRQEERMVRQVMPVVVAAARSGEHPGHRFRALRWLVMAASEGIALDVQSRAAGFLLGLWIRLHGALLRHLGLPARQPRVRRTVYRAGTTPQACA